MVGEGVPLGVADEHHVADPQLDRRRNEGRHNPSRPLEHDMEPSALVSTKSQTPRSVELGTSRERPAGTYRCDHFSHEVHRSHLVLKAVVPTVSSRTQKLDDRT